MPPDGAAWRWKRARFSVKRALFSFCGGQEKPTYAQFFLLRK
jgi:hypothetical protein